MSGKKKGWVALVMLLASALIMLLFCGSSPLYPTNPWVDANCFHTMARGIANGMLPYRDLIEQKGPLLYFMHVPSVLLAPDGFFGIYLLEVLALAAFMYISWQMVSLFVKRSYWPLVILAGFFIVTTRAFVWGDSAEELCAPLMAWSLYEAMRYFSDPERKISKLCLFRNGLLAGCLMWIKFSLLGLHFAWMAVIAIESVVRERKIGSAVRMCLIFLVGMMLPAIPWLAYFAANGALKDLVEVYFIQNTSGYKRNVNPLLNGMIGLFGGSVVNPLPGIMMGVGGLYMLLAKREGKNLWRKICLVCMVLCAGFFTYSGGRLNGYYYLIFVSFVPLGCIPLARWHEKAKMAGWKSRDAICFVAVLVIACGGATVFNRNLPSVGYDREKLPQQKFAEIITETENATLLNCGFLDGGFYLAADVMPSNPWFCTLLANRSECFAEQSEIVANGKVDYVVTMYKTLEELKIDDSCYELIAQDEENLAHDNLGEPYYLYRKNGLAA